MNETSCHRRWRKLRLTRRWVLPTLLLLVVFATTDLPVAAEIKTSLPHTASPTACTSTTTAPTLAPSPPSATNTVPTMSITTTVPARRATTTAQQRESMRQQPKLQVVRIRPTRICSEAKPPTTTSTTTTIVLRRLVTEPIRFPTRVAGPADCQHTRNTHSFLCFWNCSVSLSLTSL